MSLEAMSSESRDEEQQQQRRSPVDVIASIRKDLAEFQRTSSREALLATMREACKAALIQAFHNADAPSAVIDHLRDRGLIPPPPSRRANRAAETAAGRFNRQA